MFDTILSSLKSRALNQRDDFDTFEEYIAHTAGRGRLSTNSPRAAGLGSFLKRMKHFKIGRLGYDTVDTVDGVDGRQMLQMLPRVVNTVDESAFATDTLSEHRQCEMATVLDRFVRCVQIDQSIVRLDIDEQKMQRFYVMLGFSLGERELYSDKCVKQLYNWFAVLFAETQ